MLNLLRYSQLIALAVLVAVVVALSLLYRGLLFDSLVESETARQRRAHQDLRQRRLAFARRVRRSAPARSTAPRSPAARRSRRSTATCGASPTACRW